MASLPVIQLESGAPAVECPRCDALVEPTKNALFEGYDCPDCLGAIDTASLRSWRKARKQYEDGDE